jgi:hypothetical protein
MTAQSSRFVTWFDANGDPIMQEGHIRATETDVNTATGKAVEVETSLNVHVDFVAGTTSLFGVRNLATEPGRGVVVQHVGRVVIGPRRHADLSEREVRRVRRELHERGLLRRAVVKRAPAAAGNGRARVCLTRQRILDEQAAPRHATA